MSGEVVRYNVVNGRFAIHTRGGYIVAQLRAGAVAEGMSVEWEDPIRSPFHFHTPNGNQVEATIVDVDVPGRELMDLLGPW
jgi:hypothetical protein